MVAADELVIGVVADGVWRKPTPADASKTKMDFQRVDLSKLGAHENFGMAPTDEERADLLFLDGINDDQGNVRVSGGRAAMPRKLRALPLDSKVYRAAVLEHLRTKGLKTKRVFLHQVFAGDLDGDGDDEVLISASSKSKPDQPAKPDDYAVLLVRVLEGKAVKTIEMRRQDHYGEDRGPFTIELLAIADLDGDGTMEVVIRERDPVSIEVGVDRVVGREWKRLSFAGYGS